ncbi:type IX secretion/gliding motility protein PorT/SprT [Daejeonella lutea]|uniref:Probable protein-translocating porin PorT n=1 Tax=Daejeonella lutea TaxID=572036 RepID=A0A1T5A110_9SPHI|nr:outer membrane beta-barrel protein [Daejeonella lutea]SKB28457.1 probable protein-translocating porin PorT [Daejeonella lutea]
MKKNLYLTFLLAVIFHVNLFAQQNWGGGVDNETLHFGFKFQYVAAEYKIQKTAGWRGPFPDPIDGTDMVPAQLISLSSPVSKGFALGFVSDYKLSENTNLRFTPGLVFSDISAIYEFDNPTYSVQKKVQATFVDLPIGFKLKTNRLNNYRAYIIAGAKYSMDIVSKKKKDDSALIPSEKYLKSVPNSLWYEAGLGLDLYFEWFKLSPEIKFSQTTKSVLLDKDRLENPYIAPIDKMFLRNFQFSLFFE